MLRNFSFVCVAVFASLFSFSMLNASDTYWPGWLGPNRDGWVADFQPPQQWSESLQKVWSVEVGTGYATPVVANGKIYQHARQGNDEVVWCIDLDSGETIWQKSSPVPFQIGGGGEKHGKGPKSNPIYADGRLFTMSITGTLTGWDTESGEKLWASEYHKEFGKNQPYWGVSTSPIVDEDRVIAHFGTDERGTLVALDVKTGNEIWRQGTSGTSYSSPLLAELHGVKQIVEWNHDSVVGVNSESGKLLWEYPYPHVGTNQNMPTPAIHDGKLLIGGENRGVLCIEPDFTNGKWSVEKLWHQKEVALDMSSAVMNGDLFFGMSHYDKGRIFALDPESGNVRWVGPGRTGENVAFLSIPNFIIAQISSGEIHVIKATGGKYEKVADYQVSETPTWAAPVLLDDGLLVKDHETLTRWNFGN